MLLRRFLLIFISSCSLFSSFGQKVGIGSTQFVPVSTLDVKGNATIGSSYSGANIAPTDGLLIQGNTSIGTTSNLEQLDVYGDININNSTTDAAFRIKNIKVLQNKGTNNLFVGDDAGKNNTAANNTFVGYNAGYLSTTGTFNSFVGANSGNVNTTGMENTFLGALSGSANTTGSLNTFLGAGAGFANVSGTQNTYVGLSSGTSNTNGTFNTFVGCDAAIRSTTGSANTCIGFYSGQNLSTGSSNIFIGEQYLTGIHSNNCSGNGNIVVGPVSGSLTSGSNNVFLGFSGGSTTTGSFNVFLGDRSDAVFDAFGTGFTNTTGSNNVLLGSGSDFAATNLTNAIAIGSNSIVGASNTMVLGGAAGSGWAVNVGIGTNTPAFTLDVNGAANIALNNGYWIGGNKVLFIDGSNNLFCGVGTASVNTGSFNTFLGPQAGTVNTTGSLNTFAGSGAGLSNTSGTGNVFVGLQSGAQNSSGNSNTFLGAGTGHRNSNGSNNVEIGYLSGYDISGGSNNVIMGNSACYSLGGNIRPLNNSIIIGNYAGYACTSDNNILIGSGAVFGGGADALPGVTNAVALGNGVSVSASNTMVFGGSTITAWGFGMNPVAGHIIDVNTGLAGSFMSAADGLWYNTSDVNAKENFQVVDGKEILEKIEALPILKWNYKNDVTKVKHIGPMAQNFYGLYHLGVSDKSISSIDPAGISLAAIQELYKELKTKDEQIRALEERISRLEKK